MSEETFDVALGGRRWALPHLPFRAIKAIQPALFDIYLAAGGPSMSSDSVARLGEAELDRLAEATWRAIAHVDPALSYADFLDLPFSVGELIQAFPAVAKAAGLRPGDERDAGGVAAAGKVDFDALIAARRRQHRLELGSGARSADHAALSRAAGRMAAQSADPLARRRGAQISTAGREAAPARPPTIAELKAAFPGGAL